MTILTTIADPTTKVAVTENIASTRSIAAIPNPRWTSGSTGDCQDAIEPDENGDRMRTGAATQTSTQILLDYTGACGRVTAVCLTEPARPSQPESNRTLSRIDNEALSRFEGEGGRPAPEPATPHPRQSSGR